MQIVINNTYGGFGLSHKALLRLRELGDKTALSETDFGEMWNDDSGLTRKPFGDYDKGSFCHEIPRDSVLLIQVIKELGEDANGSFARLKIVEIPDGIEWCIEECAGLEWIEKKSQNEKSS